MSELTLEKEITKLERYLVREGRRDFIDEMRAALPVQLDSKMLGLAKHREEIRNTKADDKELRAAAQLTKDLGAPYRDQLRMNEKLTRFVALLMNEQGLE